MMPKMTDSRRSFMFCSSGEVLLSAALNARQVTTIFTRRGWLEAGALRDPAAVAAGLRGRALPPLLLQPGGGRGLRRPQ